MGRGKVEAKYIERKEHRQVTFSKRKNGLKKKIGELSIMCDAEIALIIFSNTGRLHQHSGKAASVKQVVHRYLQHPQAQLRYDQIFKAGNNQGGVGKRFDPFEFYAQLSQWPTFPQVFIKGEFVGGSDILLSMHQSGELKEMLQNMETVQK